MEERLQKLLSAAGICSRRTAEEYITAGRVSVNGVAAKVGDKADLDRDTVLVDGVPLPGSRETVWLMLYKPRGYVTTLSDEKGRKTAAELVKGCNCRVWPVGRLDLDSEGLLLFTNDGEGTNQVLHPSHELEKEYYVTVTGDLEKALPILTGPLKLDGDLLAPAQVRVKRRTADGGELSVTIHQGKNRQVRRMCAIAGLEVKRLIRVREGPLLLDGLIQGKWRFLSRSEVASLTQQKGVLQDG
jgi:23S rRNA pseudouridine2605 synthase